ncbi:MULTISPECIES: ABC transporter permease [Auritidibacter]|uniref:ABC transporter permease n=1 Tax=Auritidibacter TaxID=1160973 RepID=UPI000D7289AE|nr:MULTISPECIES: ABC transporter permease [Auritidibacter]PXA80605.1 ABC transporter permease [Auritidibacter sp. NML120636]WGH85695.1 ABC transporter permease [Auritidibacter ignavus]WGH87983.1 ABC transporter permease [Auritidibacter ignavus]
MLKYILKRLGSTVLILFGATLLSFVILINTGDPLADLREIQSDNVEFLMQERIERMGLDQPWYVRYWDWLSGVLGCFAGSCDFGTTITGAQVTPVIAAAAEQSLRLVFVATVAAILIGVMTGIVTAMRQYSLLDYLVTFFIFLFWSLPIFWAAVLAKEWLAIRFNDWMLDPHFTWPNILILATILAIVVPMVLGGSLARRLITGGMMFAFVCAVLPWMNAVNFMTHPRLGPVIILIGSLVLAAGFTALFAGLRHRRVLYSGLTVVALGMIAYYATWNLLEEPPGGWFFLGAMFVLTIAICVVVGRSLGGYAKGPATAVSVLTGALMSGMILLDHFMYHWPGLLSAKPRPVSTIGSHTPTLDENFWVTALDQLTQLWLPSVLMALLSLATYTRYTRSSMLEVQKQDFVRTARAKGVAERTVILKHAFRNAMIPLVTIVAFDFAALISGSIVVEQVFGWNAMGNVFITGMQTNDPAPVMAFILVTGSVAVMFNLLADILYAVLDPRIRV